MKSAFNVAWLNKMPSVQKLKEKPILINETKEFKEHLTPGA